MFNFNNHQQLVPNFSVPPPPLNSTGIFFPPLRQPYQQQSFAPYPLIQPQMNNSHYLNPILPQWGFPPPPLANPFTNNSQPNLSRQSLVNVALDKTAPYISNQSNSALNREETRSSISPIRRTKERRTYRNRRRTSLSEERLALYEELHIDMSNGRDLSANNANEQKDIPFGEMPPGGKQFSGSSEDSPESVQLIPTDDTDSDGEHPEMGRNWRMLMLFNGRVLDTDLPPNCERPQTDDGRTFPFIPKSTPPVVEKEALQTEQLEKAGHEDEQQRHPPNSSTYQQECCSSTAPTINGNGHGGGYGYVSRSGKVWISNELAKKQQMQQATKETGQETASTTNKTLAASNASSATKSRPPAPNVIADTGQSNGLTRKRFHNRSLIIFKNGVRAHSGSKACFQFLETGTCSSGIFCDFEHNGSVEHSKPKVCRRLLHGQCRHTDDNCPDGPHSPLLPHQLPVCVQYLNMCCIKGKDACIYLHVKHTERMEPCEEFNRGCCFLGVMCNSPHRYRYHRIKEKQAEILKRSGMDDRCK